jgi:hypothetical protein
MVSFANSNGITYTTDSSGILYQIISSGNNNRPTLSSNITVDYVGKLMNGTTFDSSNNITFPVTLNDLIDGWKIGLPLIGIGGRIKLIIPSSLAYGCQGGGSIPSNSPLYFDITLDNATNTVTPTPTPTATSTPTPTPTITPTPLPVTGYGFNLVVLPYTFPTTGNTIMNQGVIQTGSTDPSMLATNGRGIYWNSIDSDGIDRTDYYSQFTGQTITVSMTQGLSTVIYSGDTSSFKLWDESPSSGFVFGTGIGLPPVGSPSGVATLIQSGTTWNVGEPVYISVSTNS